jgi:AmmeMemoRadiSam system protein B
MALPSSKPKLRPVEAIVVPDDELGKALVLRDTEGIQDKHVRIPMDLVPIVSRFTGRRTCEDIAADVSQEAGGRVPVELVVKIATELEESLFCDGPAYREKRNAVERAFNDAAVRPASHAGGAYHGDARRLANYIDVDCIRAAAPQTRTKNPRLRALVSPHIDPWRGAVSYGHAYGFLRDTIADDVDTFVVLGTSHAPMHEAFALLRKAYATPFGDVQCDEASIDALAQAATFDAYRDQLNHKREHSIEFQAVFLKHVMGERPFRIIPILCGLGDQQATGADPATFTDVERFMTALRRVVDKTRAVVVAGADLAHVGPRFGDKAAYDEKERDTLDVTDRASLAHTLAPDATAFWEHVARDLETRRVCGLAPIYSLLRVAGAKHGELLHYEQTIDPDEGSIVSHAAIALTE